MKVGVVTGSISRMAGGLFESVRAPTLLLEEKGIPQEVFGLKDRFSKEDSRNWSPLVPRTFSTLGPRFVGLSPHLKKALMDSDCELIHNHGIWLWLSGHVNSWHRRTKRPYIISPHGMVDPWALRNSWRKKRVARWLFEDRHLHEAACLRALCESEAEAMRAYGLRNPIAVIPNGVALPAQPGGRRPEVGGRTDSLSVSLSESDPSTENYLNFNLNLKRRSPRSAKKLLLFLSRLHPKKGLGELIEAWAKTPDRKGWTLVIAGWGDPAYEEGLKALARARGLRVEMGDGRWEMGGRPSYAPNLADSEGATEGEICFAGPAFEVEKDRLLAMADGFVLPSHSEGLPMVVLEAWSYGVPVVMTAACNLPEGFSQRAAMEVKLGKGDGVVPGLAEGLGQFLAMSREAREQMGGRGRRLVEEKFVWTDVADKFLAMYRWVLGETKNRPGFIQC